MTHLFRMHATLSHAHDAQDYFRDLSLEDLHLLAPGLRDPSRDDAFTMPFLGRGRGAGGKAAVRGALGHCFERAQRNRVA